MRIRFSDIECIEVSQVNVAPCNDLDNKDDWTVAVTYEDPWVFKRLADGEDYDSAHQWAYIGEMSHEKFDNCEDAYKAAIKMVDKIFETGCLDLRNALEDWGLAIF